MNLVQSFSQILVIPATHQAMLLTIGHDAKGNPIQLRDNEDGTWSNLYAETQISDAFVFRHFGDLIADEATR